MRSNELKKMAQDDFKKIQGSMKDVTMKKLGEKKQPKQRGKYEMDYSEY